jgi:hypothetical protein
MPINPSLLISAPILQDYLVDKDSGLPLSAGIVTFYQDSQRNIYKNWYYQSTNFAPYEFLAGPNPMVLTAVGTFSDANGNDVIPFFYPYDENNQAVAQPYYVVVQNSNLELEFTRSNFPYLPTGNQPGPAVPTLENFVVNGEFWRNFGGPTALPISASPSLPANSYAVTIVNTTFVGTSNFFATTLAPSAHDGFSMPDMIALKDALGATDTITFQNFSQQQPVGGILVQDITPEYYLEWNCSAPLLGQQLKCIQIPLQLHIQNLQNYEPVTVVFHAKDNAPSQANFVRVQILQFCGTGSVTSSFDVVQTFPISTSWQKYVTNPFALPNADALILGTTGDNALYLEFAFPPTSSFDIYFAKPQLYLSSTVPTNDWQTYDQIDSIINTPRTGDVRTSINSFAPFGWVPMDDGTIGNGGAIGSGGSNATTRANVDTWPLYNLLWSIGVNNPSFIPLYTNASTLPYPSVGYGTSAVLDWNAGKKIGLTRSLGRALLGTASDMPITMTFTNAGTNLFTVAGGIPLNVYNGMPITILAGYTGVAPPFPGITYYISVQTPTTFSLFWDAILTQPVTGTFGTGMGTARIPDGLFTAFQGVNFGDSTGTYELTSGYPAVPLTATGTAAAGVRNPSTYMNIFIKL